MIKAQPRPRGRIRQGDIFRDIEYLEHVTEKSGALVISKVVFPLVIVLTQDCDLEQDHNVRRGAKGTAKNQDKWLISVLVAPLYNVEHVYLGAHLSDIGLTMEPIKAGRSPGQTLRNNERPRYHYLEFPSSVPIVPSVIDFKHYFSVNVAYLKKIRPLNHVCHVTELYREDVSQRFAAYLSRIGLPT